jgi:hypothetical protein
MSDFVAFSVRMPRTDANKNIKRKLSRIAATRLSAMAIAVADKQIVM